MEELLLGRFFAGDELHVVDQQHVGVPIMLTELILRTVLQTGDQLDGELFALFVNDLAFRVAALDLVRHREQQMRFADAARTVDEQRIVGRNVHLVVLVGGTRVESHRAAGGESEPVGFPLDEVFKRVFIDDRRTLDRLFGVDLRGFGIVGQNGFLFIRFGTVLDLRDVEAVSALARLDDDPHLKPDDLFQGVLDRSGVALFDQVLLKVAVGRKNGGVPVERDQLQALEPEIVDGGRELAFQLFENRRFNIFQRIHRVILSLRQTCRRLRAYYYLYLFENVYISLYHILLFFSTMWKTFLKIFIERKSGLQNREKNAIMGVGGRLS